MNTFTFSPLPVLALFISSASLAQVTAMPSYQNLGSVMPPQQRSTSVMFLNNSPLPLSNFNVYCMGDLSEFSCSSTCFSLSAYGSCNVYVSYQPRTSSHGLKTVILQANGPGVFAQAQVSAMSAEPSLAADE